MRILWLLPLIPYPPDTGGKQDPYFMIREFSRLGDDITPGIIYHGDKPPDVPHEFSDLVREVVFLPGNPSSLHSQLFASLSDKIPFKFRKYYSEEAVEIVVELLGREPGFDVVLVDHLHLAPLALESRSRASKNAVEVPPMILRTPNVESAIVRKYSERVDNPLVKAFARREARKMAAYEANILSEFNLAAAISPIDQAAFQKVSKIPQRIISVTAGVDIDQLRPSAPPPESGEIVFVGSFDWQPNVDGAIWFIEKVLPEVIKKIPTAHLTLVGRKPPPYLEKMANDSIALTGWVDSVEEYIRVASCCVVPLWVGSGMRLKILEAFALGRAVVSTSLGAEGIEIKDGENILIRDEPIAFADGVVEILSNSALRDELETNARELVCRKYSWEHVVKSFRSEIERLI